MGIRRAEASASALMEKRGFRSPRRITIEGLMLEYLRRQGTSPNSVLEIVSEVRSRWPLTLALRGALWIAVIGFALFLVTAYLLEWLRFSDVSIIGARVLMVVATVGLVVWFLVRPLRRRVTDEQVALYLEEHEPTLQA